MMNGRFVKIAENGTISTIEFKDNLDYIYDAIGCRLVESVYPSIYHGKFLFLCDEEFLLKDDPLSHLNVVASIAYGARTHGQPICGTVLWCKEGTNEYGEPVWCGLDEDDCAELLSDIVTGFSQFGEF